MRYSRFAVLAALMAAMGLMLACLSEESFWEQYNDKFCQLAFQCYDEISKEALQWTKKQDCIDDYTSDDDDTTGGCEYDPTIGQDCLDVLDEEDCAQFLDQNPPHVAACDFCG